ncbi:MAG: hypothetical protein J0H89_09025, partial [Rhizobiales bacterium]|nr:hypothetical protein [Hyphomicrobiales bacterium]
AGANGNAVADPAGNNAAPAIKAETSSADFTIFIVYLRYLLLSRPAAARLANRLRRFRNLISDCRHNNP